jgi:hypothetical protein
LALGGQQGDRIVHAFVQQFGRREAREGRSVLGYVIGLTI